VEDRQRDKAERHAAQQRAHEDSLKKRAEVQAKASEPPPPPPPGTICPSCQRQFPPDAEWCPHDGNRLLPMNVGAVATPSRALDPGAKPPSRKICPTCGQRFEGEATFCGKDGTALVLIN
jgi:predicted amidophosphoribosyltransferase